MKTLGKVNYSHLLVLVLLPMLVSCSPEGKRQPAVESSRFCLEGSLKEGMTLVKAQQTAIKESLPLTGKIETNPDHVIHFTSLVSGVVTKTYFSLGDPVSSGQLLLDIVSPELSSLRADKKRLEGEILVAQRQLKAMESMFEDKLASERDLLEAESQQKSLEAELEKVNANLSLYRASSERGVFQVFAPAAGVVTSKNVTAGMQIVADDTPLFTLANLDSVWAMLNIYAGNLAQIKQGMEVTISSLSYPELDFSGQINHLSEVFESQEKVLKGRVVLENKDHLLKPGMVVDVTVANERSQKAISIPSNVLVFDNNAYHAIIRKDDCDLQLRNIDLVMINDGVAYVQNGIAEGEQVIASNQLLIYEQLKNQPNH
ncbi:efflux RND transporter periplasmic adaptor subunit [Echinicola soli]|uniref:Efflux RND transporter periplasmic adaptor subunit n=1 Tax=Echinicola soli TaxID=2591634 RepID=A0A514CJN8_9BACT|nr:efflux RND transporter periplasmic adaptor subunit [Echinicola soli]QDH79864.1 efflux RND transporter periplasmic adaptor subunit [Echinicola soli]